MNSDLFSAHVDFGEYSAAVGAFLTERSTTKVPVWIGKRTDLSESILLASDVYGSIIRPRKADYGVIIGKDIPEVCLDLVSSTYGEPLRFDDISCLGGGRSTVVVVGLYRDLDSDVLRSLLDVCARSPSLSIGLLTGRDINSLSWLLAKQFVKPSSHLSKSAILSSIDSPKVSSRMFVASEKDFDESDMLEVTLSRSWRRILLQGHGKDDNINLGDYTVCGRNESDSVVVESGMLLPRCGYGCGCFKDESKLIPVRQVKAAEIVLSSCFGGQWAGTGHYDAKYSLALSAIDGVPQTVIAASGIHDSTGIDNSNWIRSQSSERNISAAILNLSLRTTHPFNVFWQTGLPAPMSDTDTVDGSPAVDSRFEQMCLRLNGLLSSGILESEPNDRSLRVRLEKLRKKVNRVISRDFSTANDSCGSSLWQLVGPDVQSLDYTIAEQLHNDLSSTLMCFDTYFATRSILLKQTIRKRRCECGLDAMVFQRKGKTIHIPCTECEICPACGIKTVAFANAPQVSCKASNQVARGAKVTLDVSVLPQQKGISWLGLTAPRYLADYIAASPLVRVPSVKNETVEAKIEIEISPETPPQSYYLTLFCVQNLGISQCIYNLGII